MSTETAQGRILLVEDDESLAEWIVQYLRDQRYVVDHLARADRVVYQVRSNPPDLIILDILLPGQNGFDLCRELRQFYAGPILMLTACTEESDEVRGLELGANDYLNKPIRPRVLLARVRAHLRHNGDDPAQLCQLEFGELKILRDAKAAFYKNQPVALTAKEFDVLWLLASNAGQVVGREALVNQLRGIAYDGFDRSVDNRISRLRRKLGDDRQQPHRIKAVWAQGYLFSPEAWD